MNTLKKAVSLAVVAATLTGCASTYTTAPINVAGLEVTYDRGEATSMSVKESSSVKVTPAGFNKKGRPIFKIAVLNTSNERFNFGVENISLQTNGATAHIYTVAELEKEAKNEATAAMIVTALAAGTAAYAANQNAYNSGSGYVSGPRGVTTFHYRSYNPTAAAAGTAAATAGGIYTMGQIQRSLDSTLAALGDSILQTTTVDPEYTYGGNVVGERIRFDKTGVAISRVTVTIGSEVHVFEFRTTKG